jgi:hypothetical protein
MHIMLTLADFWTGLRPLQSSSPTDRGGTAAACGTVDCGTADWGVAD